MTPKVVNRLSALRRLFGLGVGMIFIAVAVIGKGPNHTHISPFRRAIVGMAGLFFAYCGSLYYLPQYRRRREQFKELDELENGRR